jgi:hypothetical protein
VLKNPVARAGVVNQVVEHLPSKCKALPKNLNIHILDVVNIDVMNVGV